MKIETASRVALSPEAERSAAVRDGLHALDALSVLFELSAALCDPAAADAVSVERLVSAVTRGRLTARTTPSLVWELSVAARAKACGVSAAESVEAEVSAAVRGGGPERVAASTEVEASAVLRLSVTFRAAASVETDASAAVRPSGAVRVAESVLADVSAVVRA